VLLVVMRLRELVTYKDGILQAEVHEGYLQLRPGEKKDRKEGVKDARLRKGCIFMDNLWH